MPPPFESQYLLRPTSIQTVLSLYKRVPGTVTRSFGGRDFATASRRVEIQMHRSPPHTPSSQNSSLPSVPVSTASATSFPALQFAQTNGLVALPGGVIWSATAFEAALSTAACSLSSSSSSSTHVLT
ncbi:unnamed protein product [Dibothriocephalus latus]|uniref:Uncharacterized protein n=1 Tax=Dibothriocephalus latus TaxID=60516 RepID=A0A3P7LC72_DIBLA|nr:unnamed protein product [Dibothriocephalus latus]